MNVQIAYFNEMTNQYGWHTFKEVESENEAIRIWSDWYGHTSTIVNVNEINPG